jgi:excisionase family DNA binding protein
LIIQRGDSVTIIGAPILAAAYRSVLLGIRARRADGLPSRDLQELARALRRAHDASPPRHLLGDTPTAGACCEGQAAGAWCSAGEAAFLLGVSRRTVQRMAADPRGGLDAIRIGRTWALRRAPVLALAAARERKAAT